MAASRFPLLRALICATFNQDWMLYYDDWEGCLKVEIGSSPVAYVEFLSDEIDSALAEFSDHALKEYFLINQAGISPMDHAGMSRREWLKEVQDLMVDELSRRRG